ncbi:MAG: type II secretion system major pseudopilin GspG [Gammaproteobacteria bacterium]|nr:type II secretion system major pseudopilin GspG [Gammaproteobacteria bacterium]MBU6509525.1 type II secretion system major pseudopilin GspG [Gammaproteobacteria bacterium]MDE1982931.1 type II secretion system major pseudopilin GspG [Gammaproteobacteria bacterium]MDE2109127.1 type II secretion system major pseudopilin GspG [Gammaproteobacteria bacterium]
MRIRQQLSGFTLIEVMVVVVILGILASIIVPKIMDKPDEARIVKAKQDIRAIQSALEMYKLDNFVYPTTDQGLQALVTKPTTDPVPAHWKQYLDRLPVDPWDNPYQYLNPGVHGPIDIWTYGPKGSSGGSNSSAGVIGNWNLEGNGSTSTGNSGG